MLHPFDSEHCCAALVFRCVSVSRVSVSGTAGAGPSTSSSPAASRRQPATSATLPGPFQMYRPLGGGMGKGSRPTGSCAGAAGDALSTLQGFGIVERPSQGPMPLPVFKMFILTIDIMRRCQGLEPSGKSLGPLFVAVANKDLRTNPGSEPKVTLTGNVLLGLSLDIEAQFPPTPDPNRFSKLQENISKNNEL